MRNANILALGGALTLASAVSAGAADVGRSNSGNFGTPNFTRSVAGTDWSGAYAGVTLGYGAASFGSSATVSAGTGWLGGGYVGYNMQTPSNWVFGLEADALWSGIGGTSGVKSADLDFLSTLRLRTGMSIDRFLVYGTAGLAMARVDLDDNILARSRTHWGASIGAGIETMINRNLTGRVEYDYVGLGGGSFALNTNYSTAPSATMLKAGLGVKF